MDKNQIARMREIANELLTNGASRQDCMDSLRAGFDQLWTLEARAVLLRKEAVEILKDV